DLAVVVSDTRARAVDKFGKGRSPIDPKPGRRVERLYPPALGIGNDIVVTCIIPPGASAGERSRGLARSPPTQQQQEMAIPSDGSAVCRGPGRVGTQRLNHRQAGPAELPIRSLIRAEPYEPTTRSIIEQIKQRLLAWPPCGVVFA